MVNWFSPLAYFSTLFSRKKLFWLEEGYCENGNQQFFFFFNNKVDHLDASHPGENTFASYSVIGRCPNPNLKKSIVFLLCSKKNGINMVKN